MWLGHACTGANRSWSLARASSTVPHAIQIGARELLLIHVYYRMWELLHGSCCHILCCTTLESGQGFCYNEWAAPILCCAGARLRLMEGYVSCSLAASLVTQGDLLMPTAKDLFAMLMHALFMSTENNDASAYIIGWVQCFHTTILIGHCLCLLDLDCTICLA